MNKLIAFSILYSVLAFAQTTPPADTAAPPTSQATPAAAAQAQAPMGTMTAATTAPVVAEIGMINQLHGDVTLTRDNQDTAAKVGQKIRNGDMLTTSSHAGAKLVMRDHNVLSVSENSSISFAEYTTASVLLNTKGSIHAEVHQKYDDVQSTFRLRTTNAVAGVRGTEFLSEQQGDHSVFTTFEGSVQVGDTMQGKQIQNATLVAKGEQAEQYSGVKAETPVKLSPSQLSKLRARARSMKIHVSKNHDSSNGGHLVPPKAPLKRHGK